MPVPNFAANLKVQMCFYHAQIMEGDIATKTRRWLPHAGRIGITGRIGCEGRPAQGTVEGLRWMEGQ